MFVLGDRLKIEKNQFLHDFKNKLQKIKSLYYVADCVNCISQKNFKKNIEMILFA